MISIILAVVWIACSITILLIEYWERYHPLSKEESEALSDRYWQELFPSHSPIDSDQQKVDISDLGTIEPKELD